MRSVWLCAAAVAACIATAPASAEPKRIEYFSDQGWSLAIRLDRFVGRQTCLLQARHGRMAYQPGAVGFRMANRGSILSAWYRVDDVAPVGWRDDYPVLIAAGVSMDGPSQDDPTAGMVWLPFPKVEHAAIVRIRGSAHGKGHVSRMRGLSPMLEAAHRLGGSSDASFVS